MNKEELKKRLPIFQDVGCPKPRDSELPTTPYCSRKTNPSGPILWLVQVSFIQRSVKTKVHNRAAKLRKNGFGLSNTGEGV